MEKPILIQGGASAYRIVIPAQPAPAERYAAEELSRYLQKSTGALLPVEEEGGNTAGACIFLGNTAALEKSGARVPKEMLNKEGFAIAVRGGQLFLYGANLRGTLYAVYDFLERFCGIRFLTESSEYIPHVCELALPEEDILSAPAFSFRSIQGLNTFSNPAFAAKLRTSNLWTKTDEKYGGGYIDELYQPNDHSFFNLLPPSKYYKDHPDWYNTADNVFDHEAFCWVERGPSQLCLTNEEMIAQAIENLKGWVLARPHAQYFMIGQCDMNPFCECERCRESYRKNGGKSGTLLLFINRLAEAIEEWSKTACPSRAITIQTFAYQQTLKPPVRHRKGVAVPVNRKVVPRKNVMVKIAIDKADFFKPLCDPAAEHNRLPFTSLRDWHALTHRLYMWDYTTNFYGFFAYFANLRVLKENILTYKEYGIESVLSQNSNQSKEHYQGQLKFYILSKLLWDPDRDVWALVKEFNTLHFGADIEPYIAEVTDMFERYYGEKDFYGVTHGGADYLKAECIDRCLLTDAIAVFDRAIEAVKRSARGAAEQAETIKRILSYKITPQYMLLNNYDAYYPGDEAGKRAFAEEFFRNTDLLGVEYYRESENPEISYLKQKFLGRSAQEG